MAVPASNAGSAVALLPAVLAAGSSSLLSCLYGSQDKRKEYQATAMGVEESNPITLQMRWPACFASCRTPPACCMAAICQVVPLIYLHTGCSFSCKDAPLLLVAMLCSPSSDAQLQNHHQTTIKTSIKTCPDDGSVAMIALRGKGGGPGPGISPLGTRSMRSQKNHQTQDLTPLK